MGLFLGIDGGQSSTSALIARDDGSIIGQGISGPCNHVKAAEAAAKFSRVIAECITQACEPAGLDASSISFSAACCGMSGGPEDKAALFSKILRTQRLRVVTDGEIALTGALSGKPGIIVIAGTGSICLGRNAAGMRARAGGWGYVFGDEGSAFEIVRQATRAALRFEEGWGPQTALHCALLDATGEATANRMMHEFYTDAWPRSRVAALSLMVDQIAMSGDAVARAILDQAAQSLSLLAACVRSMHFSPDEEARVSYAGGVFRSGFVLEHFQRLTALSGCLCVKPELDPAQGALLEAFQLCGLQPTISGVPGIK